MKQTFALSYFRTTFSKNHKFIPKYDYRNTGLGFLWVKQTKIIMKKVVVTYGLIAGAIVSALMYLTLPIGKEQADYSMGEALGYATMIIALSMVFFGIKSFRDKYLEGSITFLKAFLTGLYITVIASVMYCLAWEIYYQTSDKDFMAEYTASYIEQMKADGASDAEIEEMTLSMNEMAEYYKNPILRFLMTFFMEIFPVGLIISVISALILKRKDVLPTTQ